LLLPILLLVIPILLVLVFASLPRANARLHGNNGDGCRNNRNRKYRFSNINIAYSRS
jgi:hypothetical protein